MMFRAPASPPWWRCRWSLRRRAESAPGPRSRFRRNRISLLLLFALPPLLHAAPFKVIDAGIHQTEDGPLIAPGTTFTPGEVVFFSCRLDGFQVSREKKVSIQYEITAADPKGVPIIEA